MAEKQVNQMPQSFASQNRKFTSQVAQSFQDGSGSTKVVKFLLDVPFFQELSMDGLVQPFLSDYNNNDEEGKDHRR